jgi:uncharacterized membrane protein (UPF0136 family)
MRKFAIPISLFAVILIIGGFMGFIKAQSLVSLIVSSVFGCILLISAVFIYKDKLPGLYTATFSILVLHLFFLYRFFKTFKLMPAGLMVLLTTLLGAPLLSYLTKKVKESVYQR